MTLNGLGRHPFGMAQSMRDKALELADMEAEGGKSEVWGVTLGFERLTCNKMRRA